MTDAVLEGESAASHLRTRLQKPAGGDLEVVSAVGTATAACTAAAGAVVVGRMLATAATSAAGFFSRS
ncbi:MAG TPA: hypothetical protein VNU73_05385, partial [Steroidobacteraceae bacterium]|nr:hypothetical protein [Steroidobacteraceae bacterium]